MITNNSEPKKKLQGELENVLNNIIMKTYPKSRESNAMLRGKSTWLQ